jgi:hypothetical protein
VRKKHQKILVQKQVNENKNQLPPWWWSLSESARQEKEKNKVLEEIAKTENKSKLGELKQFKKERIPSLLGPDDDYYREQEIFNALMIGKREGTNKDFNKFLKERIEHDQNRTKLATETKKQQRAIKEEYVINAYLNLIKDEKKVFANLSQNKIAKRIEEYVFPLLKNKKTATGAYVLTRKPYPDEEGKLIINHLSIDTIIDIMRKADKFTFNPFKKNTSK